LHARHDCMQGMQCQHRHSGRCKRQRYFHAVQDHMLLLHFNKQPQAFFANRMLRKLSQAGATCDLMRKAKVGWKTYYSHLQIASFGSMSMSLNTVQPCTACSAGCDQQRVVSGVRVCCESVLHASRYGWWGTLSTERACLGEAEMSQGR